MNALSTLTSPIAPSDVIDALVEGRLLHWSATSELVASALSRITFEAALDRVAASREKVLVRLPKLGASAQSRRYTLDASEAVRLFGACDGGGSIQVVKSTDPALLSLGEAVAEELGLPRANVTIGLFIAKAGNVSALHNDDVPGINVQLAGRKTWSFARDLDSANRPFEDEAHLTTGSWERRPARLDTSFDVAPGDAILVPSGMWHEVRSHDDSVSFLVSISTRGSRWVDAFAETTRRLLVEAPLARSVWLHGGVVTREQRIAEAEELLQFLRDALRTLDVGGLLPDVGAPRSAATWRWNPAAWMRPTVDGRYRFGVAGFMEETGICRLPAHALRAIELVRARPATAALDLAELFATAAAADRFLVTLAGLQALVPALVEPELAHAAE